MKTPYGPHSGGRRPLSCLIALLLLAAPLPAGVAADKPVAATNAPIPFSEIGARATADYRGDALRIDAGDGEARLRVGFQKLAAHATPEGLWLTSTDETGGRLRLVATSLGRGALSTLNSQPSTALSATGVVGVSGQRVFLRRPGLMEEYSVSVDGVRQDFVIADRPAGTGELRVELSLTGARAESASYGAKVRFDGSGRELAYSRLRVVDAAGKELTARLKVVSDNRLAVCVDDSDAKYPVRIDPTFSDANWVSMNAGVRGVDSFVTAMAVDAGGNVYIAGNFEVAGSIKATQIVKWDGKAWSPLGSGVPSPFAVYVLATIGTDLYVGGSFDWQVSPGVWASNIAKWNGSAWSSLGDDVDGEVWALAASGSDLYVGGSFLSAGSVPNTSHIAKWDGKYWSALGVGVDNTTFAIAVIGPVVYVGGDFDNAGGIPASKIARWDGGAWSTMGEGVDSHVAAMAVMGTDLYVAGEFNNAGGIPAGKIAKWDTLGGVWSAVGGGMNFGIQALAVMGTDLYAGGWFEIVDLAVGAERIARWDGMAWSDVGGGVGDGVLALAVSGNELYAGGYFRSAGGVVVEHVAKYRSSAWSGVGTDINGTIHAVAVVGNDVYAGGDFTSAVGVADTRHIARWDGRTWSALSTGMNGAVYALAAIGTNLYAGGDFTTAGAFLSPYLARWNGKGWSPWDTKIAAAVRALAIQKTNLYVGGEFASAGEVAGTAHVARWDGSVWSPLAFGTGDSVYALAVNGGSVYVGGSFTSIDGAFVDHIVKWNGSTWSSLGAGVGDTVRAIAVKGTDVYVGGDFTTAGGGSAKYIARWNGVEWSPLAGGMDKGVTSLAVVGTNLFASGSFFAADGVPGTSYVARWEGAGWAPAGTGVGEVDALAVSGGKLYAGGTFTLAGEGAINGVARWNGSDWSILEDTIAGPVLALAIVGENLYVGGPFSSAGGVPGTSGIARWNGSEWFALGNGLGATDWVAALAASGTDLYVGGAFSLAGGVPNTTYIAKWDGSAWSALGAGMNNVVYSLAVRGTDVYAGGAFSAASGVPDTRFIAKWNGSAWSALGTGMNDTVRTLAVRGSDLYAGGFFKSADGVPRTSGIARWNGSEWFALGNGVSGWVGALAASGTDLYVGGGFSFAGGVPNTTYIARWDGSAWSALGTGMNNAVYSLVVSGTDVYAGGAFSAAGGVADTRFIAKWNGTMWSASGASVDNFVEALAGDTSGHLFVGGEFSIAGTRISPYLARANLPAEIAVELTVDGRKIVDGVTPVVFGDQRPDTSSFPISFTVRNVGSVPLNITSVAATGGNAGDFIVDTSGLLASVPPGSTTTFGVTFHPSAGGNRGTTLQIASDDDDQPTFHVNLSGLGNSPPLVAADTPKVTVKEDSFATATGTFSDLQGNATVALSASVGTITPNNAAGTWRWSFGTKDGPGESQTVKITANDGFNPPVTTTFELQVDDAPPAAQIQTVHTAEDHATVIMLRAIDVKADTLTVAIVTPPPANAGTLGPVIGTNVTFFPARDYHGTNSFTFAATDSDGLTGKAALVTVIVDPVNDAPTITGIPDQRTAMDSPTLPIQLRLDDVDDDPDTLTLDGSSSDPGLVPNVGGFTFEGTRRNRLLTVTPKPGRTGTAELTVRVADPAGATNSVRFRLQVYSGPQIVNEPIGWTVDVGSAVSLDVLAKSPDGSALAYRWFKGINPEPGATNASRPFPSAQLADSGAYFVVVTNRQGSVTSRVAQFKVQLPGQPVLAGTAAEWNAADRVLKLRVNALGEGPLTFQWLRNGVALGDSPEVTTPALLSRGGISGATAFELAITNFRTGDAGRYSVRVGNANAVAESAPLLIDLQAEGLPISALPLRDNLPDAGYLAATNNWLNRLASPGTGSTRGFTGEVGEPKHAHRAGGSSGWMVWRPTSAGVATFTTAGSDFDTLLGIYRLANAVPPLTFSSLESVADDDDAGGFFTSFVRFNARPDTVYFIAVDDRRGEGGNLVLSWSLDPNVEVPVIKTQPESLAINLDLPTPPPGRLSVTLEDEQDGHFAFGWFRNGVRLQEGIGGFSGVRTRTLTITGWDEAKVAHYTVAITNTASGLSVESGPAIVELIGGAASATYTSRGKLVDAFIRSHPGIAGPGRHSPVPQVPGASGGTIITTGTGDGSTEPEGCGLGIWPIWRVMADQGFPTGSYVAIQAEATRPGFNLSLWISRCVDQENEDCLGSREWICAQTTGKVARLEFAPKPAEAYVLNVDGVDATNSVTITWTIKALTDRLVPETSGWLVVAKNTDTNPGLRNIVHVSDQTNPQSPINIFIRSNGPPATRFWFPVVGGNKYALITDPADLSALYYQTRPALPIVEVVGARGSERQFRVSWLGEGLSLWTTVAVQTPLKPDAGLTPKSSGQVNELTIAPGQTPLRLFLLVPTP